MTLPPKSSGDILYATLWNIVQALAENAMRGTNNLDEITDPVAARLALLLHAVAASGDYADLTNVPLVYRSDLSGHWVVDPNGYGAIGVDLDGVTHIARAKPYVLELPGAVVATHNAASPYSWAIADGNGAVPFGIRTDGRVDVPGITVGRAPAGYSFVIADAMGYAVAAITTGGEGLGLLGGSSGGGGSSGSTGYGVDELAWRSARAVALSASIISQTNTTAARPVWQYSHVISYGQSLSSGWEGWPSLSKTQPYDNLMLGDSDHPTSESSATWTQIGTADFNPLVATVEASGALIADATVAGYTPGHAARGESPVVGAANFWRKQQLAWRGLASDSSRRLVAASCGVGGKSLEDLSYGASPNLFNRMVGASTIGKGLADAVPATSGVAAVIFLQGENNAFGASGTGDKDTYKALLATFQADVTAQVATGVFGQAAPPAIFSYQTAMYYVQDSNFLGVSMAQLEASQEFQDWYLVAPSYPVTGKSGGHLDPNGYRWLGMQFGKVMHQVLDLGRGWKPLHPIRATYRGTQVLVDFHVPAPPLQFQPCYVETTATTYAAKGFKVTDDAGTVSITVEISGDACVLITLGRELSTNPYIWYGDKTVHSGYGNLCDSDATIASDDYEYTAGTGQYAAAEIVALEDLPYPLWNWCCLFRMPIVSDPA